MMKMILKQTIILMISLLGAFIIYKVYHSATDWKFTIAFLGGSITALIAMLIQNKRYSKIAFCNYQQPSNLNAPNK